MPRHYRKRKTYRRRKTSRRSSAPWYVKKGLAAGVAGYGLYSANPMLTAAGIKHLLNVEKKYIDVAPAINAGLTTAGTTINAPAQGDTANTRDGNSIKMLSWSIKGVVSKNAAATNTYLRMIVLLDRAPDGAVPLITEVLDYAGLANGVNAHYDPENMGARYKVLKDHRWVLNDTDRPSYAFDFYGDINNHVKFSGPSGGIAGQTQNALHVYFISNQPTNTPGVSYISRVRYVDN